MTRRERVACPGCGAKDASQNNLQLFSDDPSRGYCHLCQKAFSVSGDQVKPTYNRPQKDDSQAIQVAKKLPIRDLTHKPITAETCEKYGIRVGVSEEDGQIDRVYYPYYSSEGELTGYKIRTLPKEFTIIGKVKSLFGRQTCKKAGRLLVITEGEDDAAAAYQMLQEVGKDYDVVSLPNGANLEGQLDPATLAELDWITAHKIVVLALDNDKPGQATAAALAELISSSNVRIKILKLPRKDAGQMLIDGMADEFHKEFWTPDFNPQKIIKGSELTLAKLRTPKKPGLPLPWPKLNNKMNGLRKGEITLITGGSGLGKTQLVREIGYDLVTKHNQTVANIMLETPFEDVARAYIAMDNGVPPYKLIFNPNAISEEAYEASFNKLMKSNKFHYFEHWGSLNADVLVNKCKYFVNVLKVDFIILDHISLAVAGLDTDERKTLDMAFEALTRLCVETGVGIIVVMHLKRVPGKSWAAGDEVELTDLRGTAGAEQMSWTVIAVERNTKDEDQRDIARLRLIKNRTTGFLGLCDSLSYAHETGRMTVLEVGY